MYVVLVTPPWLSVTKGDKNVTDVTLLALQGVMPVGQFFKQFQPNVTLVTHFATKKYKFGIGPQPPRCQRMNSLIMFLIEQEVTE